jgi:hypothetical protein
LRSRCHRRLLGGIVDDRRVAPDALDELTHGPLVARGELRAPQDQFELGEQQRARDDADRSSMNAGITRSGAPPRLPIS